MKFINVVLLFITILGGFNWFLVTVFDFNIVNQIFNQFPVLEKVLYVVIGLAALYCLRLLPIVYKRK